MGIVGTVFAGSAVLLLAGVAHAQQQAPSPYSLGFSVGRAPIGLNTSLVGRAQFASFSAFGKLGSTTATRPDTATMGMAAAQPFDPALGSGLSWGGGVSWDFTRRLTASLAWESYDLRMPSGPVRSTSLGLQYRY